MRKPSACTACRSRRRRCIVLSNSDNCIYCTQRGIKCVQEPPPGGYYHNKATHSVLQQRQQPHGDNHDINSYSSFLTPGARFPGDVDARPPAASLPPIPLRVHIVKLYFDYIDGQFHSLFHGPTFKDDVARDRVPPVILHGIFALSARFSDDPFFAGIDRRERGIPYYNEACRLLDVREVSLANVQACVLLGGAAIAGGDDSSESIYYGLACRMSQLLDLAHRPTSSDLEREVNIRVWWSLCMVDVWSSAAVKLPKLMPTVDVPLPMDDIPFLLLTYDPPSNLASQLSNPDNISPLIAEMIKLNRILQAINDFNQRCVTNPLDADSLYSGVHGLHARLDRWYAELPSNMTDTEANFTWYAARGLGRIFAAVYLGYYHFGQLLFYQFLHAPSHLQQSPASISAAASTPTSDTAATTYAILCKQHASRLCAMVYRAWSHPGCDVLYAMVAHVLVIASTVQIHTLLFGTDEGQINKARERLERNFEIVLQLRPYWKPLERSMSRLRAFHETCRRSMETSFVLDGWMMRFLVEFATQVEAKPMEGSEATDDGWTLDGIA